jgi:hypothetical protein
MTHHLFWHHFLNRKYTEICFSQSFTDSYTSAFIA